MFPRSSIKRLRFAFMAMAGLTLSAFVIGYITFTYSHLAQKRFLVETTPLLINIEQLSKVVVRYSATLQQLETIRTLTRLNSVLVNHRSQSDRLRKGLLDLAKFSPDRQTVKDLNNAVQKLEAIEAPYTEVLRTKIDAVTRLSALQREVSDEGQALLDLIAPFSLESSLDLIDLSKKLHEGTKLGSDTLGDALNEVQLLTDIGFAAERFLQVVDRINAGTTANQAKSSKETLAPEFRQLTQLVLKLRDQGKRQAIAESLRLFNGKRGRFPTLRLM